MTVSITDEQALAVLKLVDLQRDLFVATRTDWMTDQRDISQTQVDDARIQARMEWDRSHSELAALRRDRELRRAVARIT